MKIIQRKSHHRSAGDCFCDLFLQSACSIYQFRQICACKNGKVLRCADSVSGNRYITADDRLSEDHCLINRSNSLYVINHASYICRKHSGIDLSACYRIDQRTFTTLWVFGLKLFYFHTLFAFDGFFHPGNTIRFVVLDTDTSHCLRESFQDYFQTTNNAFRFFHHPSVVTGDIRLTFRTVDQDMIDLVGFLW